MGQSGDASGNGKVSPFGDHKGGVAGANPSRGNDFTKNPGGPGHGTGKDLVKEPGAMVAGKSGGKDFTDMSSKQKTGTDPTLRKDSVPEGGVQIPDAKPSPERKKFLGVGSIAGGNGHKPFKLTGSVGSAGDE